MVPFSDNIIEPSCMRFRDFVEKFINCSNKNTQLLFLLINLSAFILKRVRNKENVKFKYNESNFKEI